MCEFEKMGVLFAHCVLRLLLDYAFVFICYLFICYFFCYFVVLGEKVCLPQVS